MFLIYTLHSAYTDEVFIGQTNLDLPHQFNKLITRYSRYRKTQSGLASAAFHLMKYPDVWICSGNSFEMQTKIPRKTLIKIAKCQFKISEKKILCD